jgi:methyltransferase family protein
MRSSAHRGVRPLAGSRWEVIVEMLGTDASTILDVGCRDRGLKDHLRPTTTYVGMDLFPPADVIASAEEPLPFEAGEFDAVVLADVLEHLDDPHGALDEAMRVASAAVIVLLPNLYTLLLRAQFAAGTTFGKYAFGPENRVDRHRWLMNFDQAADFTQGRARRSGWRVAREHGHTGNFRRPIARAAYATARAFGPPNLWAWEYVARLEPEHAPVTHHDVAARTGAGSR